MRENGVERSEKKDEQIEMVSEIAVRMDGHSKKRSVRRLPKHLVEDGKIKGVVEAVAKLKKRGRNKENSQECQENKTRIKNPPEHISDS